MNRTALAAVALLLLPALAHAEEAKTCSMFPRPKPPDKPGDWVEYKVSGKGVPGTIRMAVTGIEGAGDDRAFWLEISMRDERVGGVVKSLLVGDPIAPKKVRRVIMKTGQMPAMEVPQSLIGKIEVAKNPIAGTHLCSQIPGQPVDTSAPDETFTVGGKKIAAKVSRVEKDGKTYVFKHSAAVPLTGLVWADFGAQIVELTGYGRDAKTAITEEPVPLEQMMPGLIGAPPAPGSAPQGPTPSQEPPKPSEKKPAENPADKAGK
jgi:hypothetical protein